MALQYLKSLFLTRLRASVVKFLALPSKGKSFKMVFAALRAACIHGAAARCPVTPLGQRAAVRRPSGLPRTRGARLSRSPAGFSSIGLARPMDRWLPSESTHPPGPPIGVLVWKPTFLSLAALHHARSDLQDPSTSPPSCPWQVGGRADGWILRNLPTSAALWDPRATALARRDSRRGIVQSPLGPGLGMGNPQNILGAGRLRKTKGLLGPATNCF